ncbi:hypothetical protein AZE42_01937 [Rhizopogon vesiculosus]|uniref:Man(5)GlcNAc(2)-PP-dolichol translocation protein RFT1 n=1 Tax=Rhizopogon vesiculosus TaxID=180088 RepID=A0A1J8QE09_9AGAM|nr:hypothetical protein AZE42_01937 [Rhizopogon vesiculosus]
MQQAPSHEDGGLLKRSLSSVFSLMGLQLGSRILTFILNQALFRLASPQAYGTAAIQFELILSTILFLSREGVRNALLRAWPRDTSVHGQASNPSNGRTPALTNLSILPIILGLPVSLATTVVYGTLASIDASRQPYFHVALSTYALAALSELCSEPMHNQAMGEVRTGVRVRAEGLGITCKTLVTYLVLLYDSTRPDPGDFALVAFALGQLAYSAIVFLSYVYQMGYPTFWPTRLVTRSSSDATTSISKIYLIASQYVDVSILHLSLTMTGQSLVKHILTEGDKIILSWWSPLEDQGGYAIAVNYGSLVARIVFQPLEEICRVYFSRILYPSATEAKFKSTVAQPTKRSLVQASEMLLSLVSIQLSCSVLVIGFASVYLPIFLHLLLPSRYLSTSAPQVLAAWVWYIPVLAINGVLEAFFSSIATPQDLRRQSRWLIGFSIVFILSAIGFYASGFGDVSLVYANIINLSARIIYAAQYASTFFKKNKTAHSWTTSMPAWHFLLAAALSYLAISMTNIHDQAVVLVQTGGRGAVLSTTVISHLAQGVGLGLCCVVTWWITSGRYLMKRVQVKTD